MAQLAVAWVLATGEDIIPLIGARSVSQLQDSMNSLNVSLSKSDVMRIEDDIPENEIACGKFPEIKFKNGIANMVSK